MQAYADAFDEIESAEEIPGSCLEIDLSTPYDSAEYQVRRIPLYYLQGENDPNTSLEQAKYHHARQTSTKKYFIEVAKNGHNPSIFIPNSCKISLYKTMLNQENVSDLITDYGYCEGVDPENIITNYLKVHANK